MITTAEDLAMTLVHAHVLRRSQPASGLVPVILPGDQRLAVQLAVDAASLLASATMGFLLRGLAEPEVDAALDALAGDLTLHAVELAEVQRTDVRSTVGGVRFEPDDLQRTERVENIRRSIAMLPPLAPALDREASLDVLAALVEALLAAKRVSRSPDA